MKKGQRIDYRSRDGRLFEMRSKDELRVAELLDSKQPLPSRWFENGAEVNVTHWEYEPEKLPITDLLVHNGLTYGVMRYIPDFRVDTTDGRVVWIEMKGFNSVRVGEEQLKERLFITRHVVPADAVFLKLKWYQGELLPYNLWQERSKRVRKEKAHVIVHTYRQVSNLAFQRKVEKFDIQTLRSDSASYRANRKLLDRKEFLLNNRRLIADTLKATGEQRETLRGQLGRAILAFETWERGQHNGN